MIVLSLRSDIARLTRDFTALEREQLPFALALALTKTGQDVKEAEIDAMKRVFDRPTRFTLNSLMLRPATKAKQEAVVWFKDFAPKGTPAAKYLQAQIKGGVRKHKPFENRLIRAGAIPQGTYLMPGAGVDLDGHGNVRIGLYNKILSALQAQRDGTQNSKRKGVTARGARFFAAPHNGALPLGIYERNKRTIKPIFIAVRRPPTYQPRFHFFKIAEANIALRFQPQFEKAMNVATFGKK